MPSYYLIFQVGRLLSPCSFRIGALGFIYIRKYLTGRNLTHFKEDLISKFSSKFLDEPLFPLPFCAFQFCIMSWVKRARFCNTADFQKSSFHTKVRYPFPFQEISIQKFDGMVGCISFFYKFYKSFLVLTGKAYLAILPLFRKGDKVDIRCFIEITLKILRQLSPLQLLKLLKYYEANKHIN